jgi:hypothetical protein
VHIIFAIIASNIFIVVLFEISKSIFELNNSKILFLWQGVVIAVVTALLFIPVTVSSFRILNAFLLLATFCVIFLYVFVFLLSTSYRDMLLVKKFENNTLFQLLTTY